MRLVFLGSPPFATPVLERLAGSRFRPELVVTTPPQARGRGKKLEPSPLATRARELGLELIEPPTVRDEALLELLRRLEADVFFVVSYGELLRAEFLAIINVAEAGDHIVASPSLYGGTYNLFAHTLPKFGIDVTFVEDPADPESWRAAIQENTKLFFGDLWGKIWGKVRRVFGRK